MDKQRRRELRGKYDEIPTMMGVAQLKNRQNGKLFVFSKNNLKSSYLTMKMQLDMGQFRNAELQADWKALGETAFEYSVLEEKEVKPEIDRDFALRQMEKAWLERLKPYGDRGYNREVKE
ncbi:MAG: GIY-YIG nuclease family protein [Christensenellaceae bacterium]|jgi:hypothetical protein|nr:GIY-YIG nuclease family protein [Christensenellaceae bacterium]